MKWSGMSISFVCLFALFWFFACFIYLFIFHVNYFYFLEIYFGFFNGCLTDCL